MSFAFKYLSFLSLTCNFTSSGKSIVQGLKLVPKFPLNLQYNDERLPDGIFGVYTKLESVGRHDFTEGRAIFAYIPNSEADGS